MEVFWQMGEQIVSEILMLLLNGVVLNQENIGMDN